MCVVRAPVPRNVSFRLRNVRFRLRNVRFRLRNVSFRLRNVSFRLRNRGLCGCICSEARNMLLNVSPVIWTSYSLGCTGFELAAEQVCTFSVLATDGGAPPPVNDM